MKAENAPVIEAMRRAYLLIRDVPEPKNPAVSDRIQVVLDCIYDTAERIKRL